MEVKITYPKSKCAYCGKPFTKTHNRQTYCSDHCRREARREKNRTYRLRNYYKHRNRQNQTQIGTRTIGPHKHPDNEREAEIVSNEVNRMGLQSSLNAYTI